jgi:hypothetical protein
VLLPGLALAGCAGSRTAADGAREAPLADELCGSLTTRYRARDAAGGGGDQDLVGVLAVDLADDGPATERRGWSASLMALGSLDLDGLADDGDSTFTSLADTRGDAFDARLYHAWVELADVSGLESLRFGRQLATQTPEVAWYDGVALATPARGGRAVRAGLYGGVPVHVFESSSAGDALGGVFVEARPWNSGRVRLDYMRIEDERDARTFDDDLLGLDVWHTFGRELSLHAATSHLEGRPRDARLDATWLPNEDWVLRASAYHLDAPQVDRSLEANPLFDTLRVYQPFDQGQLFVTRYVNEHLTLDLGADVRRVRDEEDLGDFNRDFERAYLTATLEDALPGGLALAVTYDDWESDESSIEGFDAELSRTFGGDVAARLGTDVSLFEYDFFLDAEREDVRTWYLGLSKRPRDGPRVDLRFEYQEDDTDRYRDVILGVTWRF